MKQILGNVVGRTIPGADGSSEAKDAGTKDAS